jgi:hypothetical protein
MFFRRPLGPRPALGPSRNGSGDSASPFSSRPSAGPSPRELSLERELATLRAQQAALVRAEAEERANLTALEDRLDTLANEIDTVARRARNPALRENGAAMISRVKAAAQTNGAGCNTQIVVDTIKYALGIGPSPWAGPAPPAAPSAQPAAVRADPQAIVDAGAKLRGDSMSTDVRTGQPRPLPSPVATLDPVARGIVRQGRLAKNEKLDD